MLTRIYSRPIKSFGGFNCSANSQPTEELNWLTIYEQIDRATDEISKNVFCGRNVKKRLIPRELINKYGFDNLWIYNLRSGWRLLYSVTSPDKIQILAIVLDWMNHKDYEKLFKF